MKAKKKPELKIGDTIQMTDDDWGLIEGNIEQSKDAKVLMREGARLERESNDRLWEKIKERYPETSGHSLKLNNETKTIIVTSNFDSLMEKLEDAE